MTHLSAFAYKAERQTKKANLNTHLAQLYYLQIRIQTEPQAEIELGAVAVAVADNPSANQCESQCALYGRSLSPGHVCQLCLSRLSRLSVTQSVGQFLSQSVCPPLPRQSVSCRCSIYGIASPQLRATESVARAGTALRFPGQMIQTCFKYTKKLPEPAPNANRMARNDKRARAYANRTRSEYM